MEFGVITSSLGPSESPVNALEQASNAGYKSVQLTWVNGVIDQPGLVSSLQIAAKRNDIHIASLCAGHSHDTHETWPINWSNSTIKHLDLANDLGIPLVTEHARAYNTDPRAFQQGLSLIMDHARKVGVDYAVETQCENLPTMFTLNQDFGVQFCFDAANLVCHGNSNAEVYDMFKSMQSRGIVAQVHLQDWCLNNGYDVAIGEGNVCLMDICREMDTQRPIVEIGGNISTRRQRLEASQIFIELYIKQYFYNSEIEDTDAI